MVIQSMLVTTEHTTGIQDRRPFSFPELYDLSFAGFYFASHRISLLNPKQKRCSVGEARVSKKGGSSRLQCLIALGLPPIHQWCTRQAQLVSSRYSWSTGHLSCNFPLLTPTLFLLLPCQLGSVIPILILSLAWTWHLDLESLVFRPHTSASWTLMEPIKGVFSTAPVL